MGRNLYLLFFSIFLFFFQLPNSEARLLGDVQFFSTPSAAGINFVLQGIAQAKKSIHMVMFHLTLKSVINALLAVDTTKVEVILILDQGNLKTGDGPAMLKDLLDHGIRVIPSSTGFTITHQKSMIIDQMTAYLMSLNLTGIYTESQDYAITTHNIDIIQEMEAVFQADIQNAKTGGALTPVLTNPFLLWSPSDSKSKLLQLVNGANHTLDITVENLGDPDIQAALIAAATQRGVKIQIIVPEWVFGNDAASQLRNYPFLYALNQASPNIKALVMPFSIDFNVPPTPGVFYIHGKTIVADAAYDTAQVYLGSENYTYNSLEKARELGIILSDQIVVTAIANLINQNMRSAISPPTNPVVCPITPPATAAAFAQKRCLNILK